MERGDFVAFGGFFCRVAEAVVERVSGGGVGFGDKFVDCEARSQHGFFVEIVNGDGLVNECVLFEFHIVLRRLVEIRNGFFVFFEAEVGNVADCIIEPA